MNNINEILNKVDLERCEESIVLKAKIIPDFYPNIIKAFFENTGIYPDTLCGNKSYRSKVGDFSFSKSALTGIISNFDGKIYKSVEDKTVIIALKEDPSVKQQQLGDTANSALIDLYIDTDLDIAEKFLNSMNTSLFEQINEEPDEVVNKKKVKKSKDISVNSIDNSTEKTDSSKKNTFFSKAKNSMNNIFFKKEDADIEKEDESLNKENSPLYKNPYNVTDKESSTSQNIEDED